MNNFNLHCHWQLFKSMAISMQFISNFDNDDDDDDDAGSSGEQVYGFGAGKRGQLGISKKIQTVNLPILSSNLEAAEIVGIAAGGDHSAALSGEHQTFFVYINSSSKFVL